MEVKNSKDDPELTGNIKSRTATLREKFYRGLVKVLIRIVYRIEYIGFEKIPEDGAAMLISNHVSYMDGLIIDSACKRPIRYIIDKNIYNWPGVHHFMSLYKAIPIEPKRESVEKALHACADALKEGDLLCIFPEGQITYTGNMTRFRYGVEWILKRQPVVVYPIALRGLWGSIFSRKYIRSRFKFFPRSFRRRIVAICGDPIPVEIATIGYMQRVVMSLKNSISFERPKGD